MSKKLFHIIVILSFIFFNVSLAQLYSQTSNNQKQGTDSIVNLSKADTYLKLNQRQIMMLPFRQSAIYGMITPSAYHRKGNEMYYYGIKSDDKQFFIDGMQVRDAEYIPVRLIQSYELFTTSAPIELGFSAASITQVKSIDQIREGTFLADLNTDLSYDMQGLNGELFLGIPLASKKNIEEKGRAPYLFIAGKYSWTNNYDPIWRRTQELKAESLKNLFDNPLRPTDKNYGTYPNSEFVTQNDFQSQKVPSNHGRNGIYPFIKLELPVAKNASLIIGNYSSIEERTVYNFDNTVFNSSNNLLQSKRNFDTYVNWNQKIDVKEDLAIGYDVHLQYSSYNMKTESEQHRDQFFDYGYVGNFTSFKTPTFELGSDSVDGQYYENVWLLNSWDYDTLVQFTPGTANPGMAAYTKNLYEIYEDAPFYHYQNLSQIQLNGGLINGDQPNSVYDLYNNTGHTTSNYYLNNNTRVRMALNFNVDYKQHHISFGGEYNQENIRHYALAAGGMWNLMRGLTNFHLHELDLDNPIAIDHNGYVDTIIYQRKYDAQSQRNFDINLREAMGLSVDGLDYILTDSYNADNNTMSYYDQNGRLQTSTVSADLLQLDLFSASELLNAGYSYVSYAGYNHTGTKQNGNTDPYSFYSDYSIGSMRPSYWSAYLQDDFTWKNLHVRLGLRLDVYDAKRPALNDTYSLFPIFTVNEAKSQNELSFDQPANIGDDYVVYVDKEGSPNYVTGYRNGDDWYDAGGREIDDPNILDAGSGISPYLKYPDIYNVGDDGWTPEMTFSDAKKSVMLLPQINLDYTIIDRINLYVSYSSFSRNPYSINDYKPEAYYFWDGYSETQVIPNPSIKPMRTSKLFAGIKALVWKNLLADASYLQTGIDNFFTIKIVEGGYPKNYFTYANSSERISTRGFQLKLDWLNPTVSGATVGLNFVKLFPNENDINYTSVSDMVFNAYLGYRFANKYNYKGPAWGNNKVLRGLAASIYYQFRHGTPYYYTENQIVKGTRRTPSVNTFNLNIQKDFVIGNRSILNVYLTIENLFNIRNVYSVYRETGSAEDDGFLTDPANQNLIDAQLNPETYRLLYQMQLYNPDYFDIPRIWRVGVIFKI